MKRIAVVSIGFVTMLAWAMVGCSKSEPQRTAPTASAVLPTTEPADAKTVYKSRCVVCHGEHGAGDGPGAAGLVPKPRAFADPAWQTSVTDEHIKKIILEGGGAVGKSPAMPPNQDLKGKDEVLSGLVKLIREFKK